MSTLEESDDIVNENDPQEELVIVEEKDIDADDEADDSEELSLRQSDDDDSSNDDGTDRSEIRERRRKEKKERKERREKAMQRDKMEREFLLKRNKDLEMRVAAQEQRNYHADLSALDAQISKAQNDVAIAEKVIAKAVAAGNGDDVAQAMRYRDQAIVTAQQLAYQKQQAAQYQPPAPQTSNVNELAIEMAKEFISENKWYDPTGKDEDSAIVMTIDKKMIEEGKDPATPEYWDELRARAARRLPDRFSGKEEKSHTTRAAKGGPAIGSGRSEASTTSTRREIYISPERKQAMVEAGVWDDPVLRMKYVKRYAQYDREQGRRG